MTGSAPTLSIIVIFHNMRREAARTLYSLSSRYQMDITAEDYEVIAIDNGSTSPLDPNQIESFEGNFKYHFFDTQSVSPVEAINFGTRQANGQYVAIIVDGARMVTPGIIAATLGALQKFENPFVCTLAWHLGPDVQRKAIETGYCKATEDGLLQSIDWPDNGYRLFEISTLAPSSAMGFEAGMPMEFSWSAVARSTFLHIGGFDTRFQSPGGGLVNHDYLKRVLALGNIEPVVLLGEGSFHQMHGGIATNAKPDALPFEGFAAEYRNIRGEDFVPAANIKPSYFGEVPDNAVRFTKQHIEKSQPFSRKIKNTIKGLMNRF